MHSFKEKLSIFLNSSRNMINLNIFFTSIVFLKISQIILSSYIREQV